MGQKYVYCICKRLEAQEHNNSPLLHYLISGDKIQERVEEGGKGTLAVKAHFLL